MVVEMNELDKTIIREVQGELPLQERPYQQIAERIGISEERLLERLKALQKKGQLRRIGAILYHRKLGYSANGMGAWIVPDKKKQEIGNLMTGYDEISHVYERPTYSDWPYNLFSMIHGQSRKEVETVAEDISHKTGIQDYIILYSTEELKKVSMKYFCEEE